MQTEKFDLIMNHGPGWERVFNLTDIFDLTIDQAKLLLPRLIGDMANINKQRELRKEEGAKDPAWLSKSAFAREKKRIVIQVLRDYIIQRGPQASFMDPRARNLYFTCDILCGIIDDLVAKHKLQLEAEEEKAIKRAACFLDSIEEEVTAAGALVFKLDKDMACPRP